MIKRPLFTIIALALLALSTSAKDKYPYQDASLHPVVRAQDLLSRMTLEEKVGQLVCLMGWDSYVRNGNKVAVSDKFRHEIDSLHVGMYWAVFRADPWTQKTLDPGWAFPSSWPKKRPTATWPSGQRFSRQVWAWLPPGTRS